MSYCSNQGCFEERAVGGGYNFRDQLSHIIGHHDQLYRLIGHLDQLHIYKKIIRISQKNKEL